MNKMPRGKARRQGLSATQVILIIGFAVLIVVVAAFGVFFIMNSGDKPNTVSNSGGAFIVDESNLGDIGEQMQRQVEEGMFELLMNTDWKFKTAKKASDNAYVANAKSNRRPFYFEITLDDTGSLVYTSPVIPVGRQLKSLMLDKTLKAGHYVATCTYFFVDDNGEAAQGLAVGVTLEIEA